VSRRIALACLTISCAALHAGCRAADATRPLNVLLYVVDTLRADASGAYGNPTVETPHLERIAAEGTLFENAFANSSWTRPSMASLLTGLLPVRHATNERLAVLPASLERLPTLLRRHGYHCGFVTSNPNVGSVVGFERDFDDVLELVPAAPRGAFSRRS
jgi:arylsulfatase A-like enzyme